MLARYKLPDIPAQGWEWVDIPPAPSDLSAEQKKFWPKSGLYPERDDHLEHWVSQHQGHTKTPPALIGETDWEAQSFNDALMNQGISRQDWFDQLRADAGECFNKHHRPTDSCSDYQSEAKTLGRKEGVPAHKRQYLCHYCPFQSYVTVQIRHKKGMYR